MGQSKAEFLKQFGGDYGYPDAPRGIDELRAAEFKRLEGVISRSPKFIPRPSFIRKFELC
jgi:hypothetical protein